MKLKQILKDIEGVFKPPKKYYYLGRLMYGAPYFYPRNFSSTIIKLRKLKLTVQVDFNKMSNTHIIKAKKFSNLPMCRRSKDWIFKIFGNYYWLEIGFPIMITWYGLGWKDKFDSPRYEWSPSFKIYFFKYQFCIFWDAPIGNIDQYYEQILWYIYYSNKDIRKAKETWGWVNFETKLSSWDDNYLLNYENT